MYAYIYNVYTIWLVMSVCCYVYDVLYRAQSFWVVFTWIWICVWCDASINHGCITFHIEFSLCVGSDCVVLHFNMHTSVGWTIHVSFQCCVCFQTNQCCICKLLCGSHAHMDACAYIYIYIYWSVYIILIYVYIWMHLYTYVLI